MAEGFRRIKVTEVGDVSVIHFVDKRILDEQNIHAIGDELNAVLAEGTTKILLNFTNVQYLSSAAIGRVMNLYKKIKEAKGQLVLCGISKSIMEVFTITNLNKILKIYDSEDKALESFK